MMRAAAAALSAQRRCWRDGLRRSTCDWRQMYNSGVLPTPPWLRALYRRAAEAADGSASALDADGVWEGDALAGAVVAGWHQRVFGWGPAARHEHCLLLAAFAQHEAAAVAILSRVEEPGVAEYAVAIRACSTYAAAHALAVECCRREGAAAATGSAPVVAAILDACARNAVADLGAAEAVFSAWKRGQGAAAAAEASAVPGSQTAAVHAAMMRCYTRGGRPAAAVACFAELRRSGAEPGAAAYAGIVEATAAARSPVPVEAAMLAMRAASEARVTTPRMYQAALRCFRRRGADAFAEEVVREMKQKRMFAALDKALAPSELAKTSAGAAEAAAAAAAAEEHWHSSGAPESFLPGRRRPLGLLDSLQSV